VAWSEVGAATTAAAVGVKGDSNQDLATADLAQAIGLANEMKDDQASLLLVQLLARRPPATIAAKAHLYLGILAFNGLRQQEARHEFELALWANPAIELPPGNSPKTQLAFSEARRELSQALARSGNADGALPTSAELAGPATAASDDHQAVPPPALAETATIERSHSHALAYVLGGVALAALGVGIYGEIVVANYNGAIAKANGSPGVYPSSSVTGQANGAPVWQYAAIGCFVAAGLGGLGSILTW
jgi:hypothetical protein